MRIHVENYNLGHPLTLEVEPTDTIQTLKAKIRSRIDFSDDEHMLVLDGRNLIELDGSTTLDKTGLKDEDSLWLGYKGPFLVRVRSHVTDDYCDMEVDCFETIGDLKEKIHKRMGVPVRNQLWDWHNVFYRDDRPTLLSCGIFKRACCPIFQHVIFFNSTSENIESSRHIPEVPMTTLRALVEAMKAGLSVEEFFQSDHYRSLPKIYPDKDDPSVKELQIGVEIPNMPWRFPITVKPTYTIAVVRDEIVGKYYRYRELHDQGYMKEGLFVLFYGRKRLKDDSVTLDICGIRHMDSIQIFEKAWFPIVIRAPEHGLRVRIRVKCFNTIGMLKGKLQVMTGIPPEKQRLKYLEWCLDNEKKRLVDYGIVKPVKYDTRVFKSYKSRPFRTSRRRLRKILIDLVVSSDESEPARSGATESELQIMPLQPESGRPSANEASRPTETLETEVQAPSKLEPGRSSGATESSDAVEASETVLQRPFKQRRLDVPRPFKQLD